MFVNEPSFSVWADAGRKKTSVAISFVRSSPVSISGLSYHHDAVSISIRSRTTIQSSFAKPSRCALPFALPTAGFSPATKYPFTFPSSICSSVQYAELSSSMRGRLSNSQSFSFVAFGPKYARIRLTQYDLKLPQKPLGAMFASAKLSQPPYVSACGIGR